MNDSLPTSLVGQFEVNHNLPQAEYAWEVSQKLQLAKKHSELLFLIIGKLLKEIKDNQLYQQLDYDTFNAFIQSPEVSFSRDTAYLYIRVYEFYVEQLEIKDSVIQQIPLNKLGLLIPLLKQKDTKIEQQELLSEFVGLGHRDFMLRVREGQPDTKPIVWKSKETGQWQVQYYEEHTNLISLGLYADNHPQPSKEESLETA